MVHHLPPHTPTRRVASVSLLSGEPDTTLPTLGPNPFNPPTPYTHSRCFVYSLVVKQVHEVVLQESHALL